MLIYEYKCKKCGNEYYLRTYFPYDGEKLQCPNCGAEDYELSNYNSYSEDSCSSVSYG